MRNHLSGSHLPDPDFSFVSTSAEILESSTETDTYDTSFVCVIDLPDEIAIFTREHPNLAVLPATKNNLVIVR